MSYELRALIITPDPLIANSISRTLKVVNVFSAHAHDSLSALKIIEDATKSDLQFDVFFVLAELESTSGYLFCRKIKSNPNFERIHVVICANNKETFLQFNEHKKLPYAADFYLAAGDYDIGVLNVVHRLMHILAVNSEKKTQSVQDFLNKELGNKLELENEKLRLQRDQLKKSENTASQKCFRLMEEVKSLNTQLDSARKEDDANLHLIGSLKMQLEDSEALTVKYATLEKDTNLLRSENKQLSASLKKENEELIKKTAQLEKEKNSVKQLEASLAKKTNELEQVKKIKVDIQETIKSLQRLTDIESV